MQGDTIGGFWSEFLDRFTQIDELLRKLQVDTSLIINRLDRLITAITKEEVLAEPPAVPFRHLPFYSEGTATTTTPLVLLVNADGEQGLGDVGRTGYIVNEGAGTIYATIDDGKGKSKQIRIDAGETLSIDRADDIWIDKLTLQASGGNANYRCSFSR